MKKWEWNFLVLLSTIVLIINFITKNIYVIIGTFIVVMCLRKYHEKYKFRRKDGLD
ncbi:hypothetical protein [Tepidimicrobium xylanilyticum]|uniref:hypothetical protein n=1 Tax=Tepidimicrobium xylanilyticum TaxID=1123352 RepID=UPI00264ECD91|nr:hypothetical protein [Tepidimicrobium xylanilyticum]GMG95336.1 hypothetical protein EN5CB1_01620 [Tepidimicrobium xylanilyticum]